VICGSVGLQKIPLNVGRMVHLIRETEEGCEMRSRFWIGKPEIGGLAANGVVNKVIGSGFCRELFVHCATEMNHLASFLPDLYDDYNVST